MQRLEAMSGSGGDSWADERVGLRGSRLHDYRAGQESKGSLPRHVSGLRESAGPDPALGSARLRPIPHLQTARRGGRHRHTGPAILQYLVQVGRAFKARSHRQGSENPQNPPRRSTQPTQLLPPPDHQRYVRRHQ